MTRSLRCVCQGLSPRACVGGRRAALVLITCPSWLRGGWRLSTVASPGCVLRQISACRTKLGKRRARAREQRGASPRAPLRVRRPYRSFFSLFWNCLYSPRTTFMSRSSFLTGTNEVRAFMAFSNSASTI